ncbi:MAG: cysteine desulfurase [Candidatus Marinimicrobia bacterium]|nr:cysteine desulfurase [Candidatus Neomarinimicrobiota bacterium]
MLYFDYCATTPIDNRVLSLMIELGERVFGNPSSVHQFGQEARGTIDKARRQLSNAINCQPKEIIFTSGGTEANNIVLWNVLHEKKKHVILSAIEHPSISKTISLLANWGIEYTIIPVDSFGIVNPDSVRKAIRNDTGLVTVMFVNNETGTIEPIREISQLCLEREIYFHSDGVQALGKIPVDVRSLNVTSMSFSAHKLYGPKGVGALYLCEGTRLNPLVIGGSQEGNFRAGTENVPGIAGFGLAAELAIAILKTEKDRLRKLEQHFLECLTENIPNLTINGHQEHRVPGVINITFPDVPGDDLLMNLDLNGIAVSSGSACSSGTLKPSEVLKAMGISDRLNRRTIRISFGRYTRKSDVHVLAEAVVKYIQQLKKVNALSETHA